MKNEQGKHNIKTTDRCFQILDLLCRSEEPMTIQKISSSLEINQNRALKMISNMVASGFLSKDEKTKQYVPSLKIIQLSYKALMSLDIRRVAMPYLEMLWQQYPKANYSLGVLYNNEIVVIDHLDSQNPPRTYFLAGKTLPFHATALGKILTCELSVETIDKLIISKGLRSYTPSTICSPEALKNELNRTRSEQLARARSEFIPNDNSNAVPIKDASNTIIAGISLAAFDNYMSSDEVERSSHILSETARKISSFLVFNR